MQKIVEDPHAPETITRAHNHLFAAEQLANGLSPEEQVWLAENAAQLARDLIENAAGELTAREGRRVGPGRVTLAEHSPYWLAQNTLGLLRDQAASLKVAIYKAQRRVLNPLGQQGDLESYRAD